MEAYFRIKIFVEFILPIIIFGLFVINVLYKSAISSFKSKFLKKMGYEYHKGLGENVALEFQSHWSKGNIKIYTSQVEARTYSQIKKFVKSK